MLPRFTVAELFGMMRTLSQDDLCTLNGRARILVEERHRFDPTGLRSNCTVVALRLLAIVVVEVVASVVQEELEAAVGLKKNVERAAFHRPFGHR